MFNVRDCDGKHIGFVFGRVSSGQELVVALCETPLDNSRINWDLVKSRLGDIYQCRNFWGKVKEDILLEKVKGAWNHGHDRGQGFYPASPEDYYQFDFLAHGCDLDNCIDTEGLDISGYVFFDSTQQGFENGDLVLRADLTYIEEKVLESPPIHGVIVDYPRIGISAMGDVEGFLMGASLSEFGRNHNHQTRVRIRTGNVVKEFQFPLQIAFKKGHTVQIYLTESGEITSVYHDGAIYLMNYEAEERNPVQPADTGNINIMDREERE